MEDPTISEDNAAVLKVVGIGGGGCNAVDRMVEADLLGVEFIAINTDAQALSKSIAPVRLQIGGQYTRGLGSGGDPAVGAKAAEESREPIRRALEGADMVFLTAGMGGGTGTGAAPIVAEISRKLGALTVAVVTQPFFFEGTRRARVAQDGINKLRDQVDTLIVIQNDRLLQLVDRMATLQESFRVADDILRMGVKGISEMIVLTGLINTDFQDVKAIMTNGGNALMSIGRASGEERALAAAQQAITSPLLDTTIKGATGVLWNIKGPDDMTLYEVNQAAALISENASEEANIIFGTVYDQNMGEDVEITVLATGLSDERGGFSTSAIQQPKAAPREAAERARRPAEQPTPRSPLPTPPEGQRRRSFDNSDIDIPPFLRKRN